MQTAGSASLPETLCIPETQCKPPEMHPCQRHYASLRDNANQAEVQCIPETQSIAAGDAMHPGAIQVQPLVIQFQSLVSSLLCLSLVPVSCHSGPTSCPCESVQALQCQRNNTNAVASLFCVSGLLLLAGCLLAGVAFFPACRLPHILRAHLAALELCPPAGKRCIPA
eukprot:1160874-Pelagomonas_calceolata.AAC.1